MTARLHILSWLTLAVFVPFAVIAGDPARARAATNRIVSLEVTQGGQTTTFYGSEEDGKLVLTAKDPEGLRVVIPDAELTGSFAVSTSFPSSSEP